MAILLRRLLGAGSVISTVPRVGRYEVRGAAPLAYPLPKPDFPKPRDTIPMRTPRATRANRNKMPRAFSALFKISFLMRAAEASIHGRAVPHPRTQL